MYIFGGGEMARRKGFKDNSSAVIREYNNRIKAALRMTGLEWEQNVVEEIRSMPRFRDNSVVGTGAIDTGTMVNDRSHEVDVAEKKVYVGFSINYALYVTMGTWKMPQRPFMQNSINNYQNDYKNTMVRAFAAFGG